MYVIKTGKKLNQAFRHYKCQKCGEEAIELKRDAYPKLFTRINFPDYLIEPDFEVRVSAESQGVRKCGNCGRAMSPSCLKSEDYKNIFEGLTISLSSSSTYTLKEDDLFY